MILSSYSIKGGVGKTALAVNLSYAMSLLGKRVLLIDLDPQGAAGFYFRIAAGEKFRMKDSKDVTEGFKRNIRESDYEGLDILPSNLAYRHLDIRLKEMEASRKQLRGILQNLKDDYDVILIDCPPNITLLSENIFRASDRILIPVIPTTLSQRTYEQLKGFFNESDLPMDRLVPFFSMVQGRNRMHSDTIQELTQTYPEFLKTGIPFAVEVEKMGLHREPLLVYGSRHPAADAYISLRDELLELQP